MSDAGPSRAGADRRGGSPPAGRVRTGLEQRRRHLYRLARSRLGLYRRQLPRAGAARARRARSGRGERRGARARGKGRERGGGTGAERPLHRSLAAGGPAVAADSRVRRLALRLRELPRPARRAGRGHEQERDPARHQRRGRARQVDGAAEQQLRDPAQVRRRDPEQDLDDRLLEAGRCAQPVRSAGALRPVQRPLAGQRGRRPAAGELADPLRDLGHGRPAGHVASVRDPRRRDRRDLGRLPDPRLQQDHGRDRREHVQPQLAQLRARSADRARLRPTARRHGRESSRDRRPRRLRAPARGDQLGRPRRRCTWSRTSTASRRPTASGR